MGEQATISHNENHLFYTKNPNTSYSPSMSWQDCFLLGHHLYEIQDFNHTVPWLKQSMQMLKSQDSTKDAETLDFIETVVAYHREMGEGIRVQANVEEIP